MTQFIRSYSLNSMKETLRHKSDATVLKRLLNDALLMDRGQSHAELLSIDLMVLNQIIWFDYREFIE